MAVSNGGLVALQLAIPDLPVANVVQLRNLSFSYDGGAPWDATADTSFMLAGDVVSSNSTSSLAGAITFDAAGNLSALSFDAQNVDFGAFRIDVLSFVYDGTEPDTSWSLEGSVTAGGRTFALDGSVELVDGSVVAGQFTIGQLPIGDIILFENLNFEFFSNTDGTEEWRGGGRVNVGDRNVAASADFTFAPDGSLVAGRVDVSRLEWSEMLVFDDVVLDYGTGPSTTAWALSGSVTIERETTTLSGSLALQAGRVTSGSINVAEPPSRPTRHGATAVAHRCGDSNDHIVGCDAGPRWWHRGIRLDAVGRRSSRQRQPGAARPRGRTTRHTRRRHRGVQPEQVGSIGHRAERRARVVARW